jgi:hypothetical protein
MEQAKDKKIKRYTIWGVFLVIVGGVASMFAPEHSLPHFFNLLKEIIVNLIVMN